MTTSRLTRRSTIAIVLAAAVALSIVVINQANAKSPKHHGPNPVGGGVADAGYGPQGPPAGSHGHAAGPHGPDAGSGVAPFALSAAVPAGYSINGIDVSKWQGTVDWTNVAANAEFAYVKATEGTTYVSPTFAAQYGGARAAGLYTGAYAFARPESSALPQADWFLDHVGKLGTKSLPPMLDLEWPYWDFPDCYNQTQTAMRTWIHTFVNEVKRRTGSPTLIYTAASWWNECVGTTTEFNDQLLDVAWYNSAPPTLPSGWPSWTIWQYSASGTLPGDQNVFNGSLSQLKEISALTRCRPVPSWLSNPTNAVCLPQRPRRLPPIGS